MKPTTGDKIIAFLLLLLTVIPQLAFAATLLDSYTVNNNDHTQCDDVVTAIAQGFTTPNDGNNYALSEIDWNLKRVGTIAGNMNALLYAQGGTWGTNGVPTGSALDTSSSQLQSSLTTSYAFVAFTGFSGYVMSPNTHYMAVFNCDLNDGTHFVDAGEDTVSPAQAGNSSQFFSGVWHSQAGEQIDFKVFGNVSVTVKLKKVPDLMWWQ